MVEPITNNIIMKKECEIVITSQAQMVIASSKYSIEDFKKIGFNKIYRRRTIFKR